MKGVLVGAMGLLVLHALVARANQAQLTGLTKLATDAVERFLNPALPALPDHSAGASTPAPASSSQPTSYAPNGPAPANVHGALGQILYPTS